MKIPSPELVREVLDIYGIHVKREVATDVLRYLELLLRWNEKVSLTSVIDPLEILKRHFGESFFGGMVAGIDEGSLLDVGSGAGFPALPVAMVATPLQLVLLEPNMKKAAFLAEACRLLGVEGRIRIRRNRLEEFTSTGERFDFISTRAVKLEAAFLRIAGQLLAPDGRIVLWLGARDAESLRNQRGWDWSPVVRVPATEKRVILKGRVVRMKNSVSRGTH